MCRERERGDHFGEQRLDRVGSALESPRVRSRGRRRAQSLLQRVTRRSSPSLRPLATIVRKYACTRGSAVSSGWNDVPRTAPWRTITPCPSRSASTSTAGPARSIHGARMNIAGNGRGAERRNCEVDFGRIVLAAEGVAADRYVEQIRASADPARRRRARPRSFPCTCPRAASRRERARRSAPPARSGRAVSSPSSTRRRESPARRRAPVRRASLPESGAPAFSSAATCSATSPCNASTPTSMA